MSRRHSLAVYVCATVVVDDMTCDIDTFLADWMSRRHPLAVNLQPVITNSTTIPQLRQALQSTPTFGRRGVHAQPGLNGHLTLTINISYVHIMYNKVATQLQNIKSCNQSPTHQEYNSVAVVISATYQVARSHCCEQPTYRS